MKILKKARSLGRYSLFYYLRHPIKLLHLYRMHASKNSIFNDPSILNSCSLFPEQLLNNVINYIKPMSVLDVGCGTGISLNYFLSKNIKCIGIEGSDIAIKKSDNPKNIIKHNLNDSIKLDQKFNLVWCFEVAEHIHPKFVNNFVSILTNHSNIILMSAAHPGQGGTGHFNEQPREYWISLLKKSGYTHDNELCKKITTNWEWYPENIFLFRKNVI